MAALNWPAVKDPDEVKDYRLDWTPMMEGGDTVTASNWTVAVGTGLVIDSQSFTTTGSTIWLSGGTESENYELLNRVTTAGGRTYDQTVKLRVRKK